MKLTVKETVTFALLGAILYVGDVALEFLPNIHMVGVLTVAYTVVYRSKALYPIAVYVLLQGLLSGFNTWWIPYLYIWTILWAAVMVLPRRMSTAVAIPVYMAVCGAHGLAFGTLYAPVQALIYGLNGAQTLAWIAAGFSFDVIHAVGNVCLGILVVPLVRLLQNVQRMASV